MKTVSIVGARPNLVKMAPVIAELRRQNPDGRHVLVHSGQHYDRMMSEIFFEELGVPKSDHSLGVGSGTHSQQTARVMERFEPVVADEAPDVVIASGDGNSTLSAALVAAKACVPLAHVEAGLRSFDRTMPEEVNRIVADEFSGHLFAHSDEALQNLAAEGIEADRVHLVGNTMIDSLVAVEDRFRDRATAASLGLEAGGYLLVTLHRPALVDGPLLSDVIEALLAIGAGLPVVFPAHPRTSARMDALPNGSGIHLIEPVGYLDFLSLQADAAGVLTDSGGVQEETTYLGVPCFTLRDSTERPVTIRAGTNTLLGLDPARIVEIPGLLADARSSKPAEPPPLWDGHAAERAVGILARDFG